LKKAKTNLSRQNVVSLLSILLLVFALSVPVNANAADWELWPRGREEAPGTAKPHAAAVEKAGEEGGKAVSAGVSSGTIGKAAAIAAGLLVIGIAAGSGGGGGGTTATPAHP
jgi:hypothetical protein